MARPKSFQSLDETFTLTSDHIKLLRRLNIDWMNYGYNGAPGVSSRRPFGNSAVADDIAEILGLPTPDYDNATAEEVDKFHKEMEPWFHSMRQTLQIAAQCGQLVPGHYAKKFPADWQIVAVEKQAEKLSLFAELIEACKDSVPFIENSGYGAMSERVSKRVSNVIKRAEEVLNG